MSVDLQTDILLGRLCARVLKRRAEVLKGGEITETEGGFTVVGKWHEKLWHMCVYKEVEK